MPTNLTKKEKAQCKVILALLVVSLLLEEIDKKLGKQGAANPAVAECVRYIDRKLSEMEPARRDLVVRRIQKTRIKLTKQVSSFSLEVGLLGAMQFLTGGTFKVPTGTQLSFIIETFAKNLEQMRLAVPQSEEAVNHFENIIRKVILDY